MKELVNQIKAEYEVFVTNADAQVEKGNKAAGARARKAALNLMKAMKEFRKASIEAAAESAEYIAVFCLCRHKDNNKTFAVARICRIDLIGGIIRIFIGHRLGERQKLTLIRIGKNTQFHFHVKILLDGCIGHKIYYTLFYHKTSKKKRAFKKIF